LNRRHLASFFLLFLQKNNCMKIPNRTLTLKIKENEYEVKMKMGTLIDIELTKMQLTNGQYNSLAKTTTSESLMAKYNIDMIAAISVLFPNIKEDMRVKAFADLDPVDGKLLLDLYVKQISPWLIDWLTFQNSTEEDEA
jgi:hypothetical protein